MCCQNLNGQRNQDDFLSSHIDQEYVLSLFAVTTFWLFSMCLLLFLVLNHIQNHTLQATKPCLTQSTYCFLSIQISTQRLCKLPWLNIRRKRWHYPCLPNGAPLMSSLLLKPAHHQVGQKKDKLTFSQRQGQSAQNSYFVFLVRLLIRL